VQKDILDKVEQTCGWSSCQPGAYRKRDAHEQMAEIFNNFDRQTESRFITALEERSRDAAERIKALMLPSRICQARSGLDPDLLRNVEKDKLGLALKAPPTACATSSSPT